MSKTIRITGTKGVYVNQFIGFDQENPEKTPFDHFTIVQDDGSSYWESQGYIKVGEAKVEVEFMPRDDVSKGAVVALRKQKEAVLAEAQNKATEIEQRIQSLLAITNEVKS